MALCWWTPILSHLPGDTLVSGNLASGHRASVSADFEERKLRFGHRVPLSQTWVCPQPGVVGPGYNGRPGPVG
jgi:hypothetical protein